MSKATKMKGFLEIRQGLLTEDINAYSDEGAARKAAFHRDGKNFLKQLAVELGLIPGQYDLRSNQAGIAVSGEVTLHTEGLHVWLEESCLKPGIMVIYRACRGRRDYSGLQNNSRHIRQLLDQENRDTFLLECLRLHAEGLSKAAA